MSQEAFPLRHRGAHVPDHVRRLDEIASSPRVPQCHGSGGASPRLVERHGAMDPEGGVFFRNLAVWVDDALSTASAHAGFDKAHLYLAVLRGVVDDVAPHPALQRVVEDLEAYIAYLSSPQEPPVATPRRPARPVKPAGGSVVSPRAVTRPSKSVLSPRVLRAMAKDAASEAAALPSPRITSHRPKRIVELSDHEQAILEVALFYEETVTQLGTSAAARVCPARRTPASQRNQPSLTHQWLQFAADKRTRSLKKIKRKIATQSLFPCTAANSSSAPSTPAGGTRVASGGPNSPTATATIHNLDLPSYFSLLMLCLQETTRRLGVFSAEIAAFVWTAITQETLEAVETLMQEVLARQQRAQSELERLRASRNNVHDAIAHCEREIERLQAQNMRSLAVWELERAEMATLEQEEAWHGHCKALVLQSLRALQADVNHATWLQLGGSTANKPPATPTSPSEELDPARDTMTLIVSTEPPGPVKYERLPAGAALLHPRLRARVVYVTHLIVLCRSFLHLHEKRALREVMEATSTNPRWSARPASPSHGALVGSHAVDVVDNAHAPSAMERISASELRTLRDINDALRAIEELYASTGASGDHSTAPTGHAVVARALGRDASTQFPVIDPSDAPSAHGFLRALAYSTVAAGGGATKNAPAFVRAGLTAGGAPRRRNAEIGLVRAPMGSGRRLSSSTLGAEPAAAPTQPLIRLNKAVARLPRHFRDVLILPLLQAEPFPPALASSIVESLTRDEILARIQWLYGAVLDTTMGSPPPPQPTASASANGGAATAIPLGRHLWKSWNSEQFVAFIHAAFLDRFGAHDVSAGEREFVRFAASIQLLFSGLGGALSPSSGAGAGGLNAMDKISFFTRMTQLVHLDAPDAIMDTRLPAQLFPVFFYCLYVLQQVAVTRKHIEDGGLSVDVWTVAPPPPPPSAPEASRSHKTRSTRGLPASPPVFRAHATPFVLLESVKTLLQYLLEATSPDAAAVIDERSKFLADRASPAKVALLSPVLPGAYEPHGTGANGELTDTLILPLDFVVLTLANAWLQQHAGLVARLSVAMRAASATPSGDMAFDEFTHVMLVGAAAPPSAAAVRAGQLTQIYASLLARAPGATWPELIVAVADEIDLLGVRERLAVTDLRSMYQVVARGSGRAVAPWAARPAYRGGDATALRRAWGANRAAMRDHFGLAFQAENALEGVALWHTGAVRMDRVETLLEPPRSSHSKRTDEMTADELAVAWRALYYLQLDHAQAAHVADHVRARQLRAAKPS